MDDYTNAFVQALIKQKNSAKGIRIVQKNFDNFKVYLRPGGRMELASLAKLNQWTRDVLREHAHIVNYICTYHPESPRYWLKNIEKTYPTIKTGSEKEIQIYSVSIDLEGFLESSYAKSQRSRIKITGTFIPDNYQLAKKVFSEYKKKNNVSGMWDNSYREIASWESEDLNKIKSLASFLEKKFTLPKLKKILKVKGIKTVIFNKDKIDFVYLKK